MFCQEQVAQLRDIQSEADAVDAQIIIVGSGNVEQAKAFRAREDLPFALYTDPGRRAFKAAGMRRSVGLGTISATRRAMKKGLSQGKTHGDAWQNGGALLFDEKGFERYRYVSGFAGDHPELDELRTELGHLASHI